MVSRRSCQHHVGCKLLAAENPHSVRYKAAMKGTNKVRGCKFRITAWPAALPWARNRSRYYCELAMVHVRSEARLI